MIKSIAFGLKVFEDIIHEVSLKINQEEFEAFFAAHTEQIVEMLSLCCEQKEKILQV